MANKMNIYACNNFEGYWAVGTSAVVVADNAIDAANFLNTELIAKGLPGEVEPSDMMQIDETKEGNVIILQDGNY